MEEFIQVLVYIVIMIVLIVYNINKGNKKKQQQEKQNGGPQEGQQPDPWKDIREAMGIPGEDRPQAETAGPGQTEPGEAPKAGKETGMGFDLPPEVEKMNEYQDKEIDPASVQGKLKDQIQDEISRSGATVYKQDGEATEEVYLEALGEEFDLRRAVVYSEILNRKYD
jgi:hypothetical protein